MHSSQYMVHLLFYQYIKLYKFCFTTFQIVKPACLKISENVTLLKASGITNATQRKELKFCQI